jgi:hypothetical protein
MSHEATHVEEPVEADDILQTFGTRMQAKADATKRQFDPSWILTLLSVLKTLFANCPTPPTPAKIRKRKIMMRSDLHTALRKEFPEMKRKGVGDMVEDVFDVASEAEDAEIVKFCKACK